LTSTDDEKTKPCLNYPVLDATFPLMQTSSSETRRLDAHDRRILQEIQADSTIGPAELSNRVHLSISQCSRRLQRLRDAGVIDRSVTVLDRKPLNLGITAILLIKLGNHSPENEQKFLRRIGDMPEITACHYVTGDLDFILQVTTRDLEMTCCCVRDCCPAPTSASAAATSCCAPTRKRPPCPRSPLDQE
jgi:DNA-binding Lrp family transcriptional regulator